MFESEQYSTYEDKFCYYSTTKFSFFNFLFGPVAREFVSLKFKLAEQFQTVSRSSVSEFANYYGNEELSIN